MREKERERQIGTLTKKSNHLNHGYTNAPFKTKQKQTTPHFMNTNAVRFD